VGIACGFLRGTDVAGMLGGMARSDRSRGFVELEIGWRGQ
jgi:hypothetical protein